MQSQAQTTPATHHANSRPSPGNGVILMNADIETNAAGLIRVRLTAPGLAVAAIRDHARQLAAKASRGPVEFLYAAETDGSTHDLLFARARIH